MSSLVTGLFKTKVAAEAAVDALQRRGYGSNDITVLMSEATRTKEFALENKTQAASGAGVGGALGGVVGATIAAIAAIGTTLALPGLGIVVAGPLAAALAGAGAGGATGGLIGALIGAGIPEHRAAVYEAGVKKGGVLIGIETHSDEKTKDVRKLLEDLGAEGVREE